MSLAASIGPTGIVAPSYADILAQLQYAFRSIYGSDIYIEPDSQDGQMLAVFAAAINDVNSMAVAIYNAYSPAYAQGTGLSSVVKINGIAREISTNSQADVVASGQVGTDISGSLIGDSLGLNTQWKLPGAPGSETVVIPVEGEITATATCTQEGNFSAAAGSLTKILTPTLGWQSVTNPADATTGNPVEADATLRQRQSISTSLPAQSVFDAILAAVANVAGVGRYAGYENWTGTTDDNGIPGHSISIVAEGGDAQAIGTAIATKKTPGTGTYGDTVVAVIDGAGVPINIHFFVLAEIVLTVDVTIKALPGYVSTTGDAIIASLVQFINGLDIGEFSYQNRLFGPANLSGDAATVATGQTQAALDLLAKTFNLLSITQSRVANVVDTTVTNGPYVAGLGVLTVDNPKNLYAGGKIAIVMDNAALLQATISDVTDEIVTFAPVIPGGRSIPDGANVYLVTDVRIEFNEAAIAAANNITLNVVGG